MWLVLEDNPDRVMAFQAAARHYTPAQELRLWRIARHMIEELPLFLNDASVISLDHDLYRLEPDDPEPGTGRDVANYLATLRPVCPVIIHSTNTDAAWGMYNELTYANWQVELIHHLDEPRWIQERWIKLIWTLINDKA